MSKINERISNIELMGPTRESALKCFYKQMKDWGEALPKIPKFHVLDFGLGEFAKTGLIECWIANEFEIGYCAKYLFLFDEQSCPYHWHREKYETFFIVRGSVEMICDGVKRIMKPGEVLAMDVNSKHGFRGVGSALLLEISKPCFVEDNFFEDHRIPLGENFQK